jgi:uncharacterized protein (TIGR03067 family)
MTKLATIIFCLALASLTTIASAGDKAAPKIDGAWIVTAATTDGKKVPDDVIAKWKKTFAFKDGKYTLTMGGKEFEAGTYKLDPSKTPCAIDIKLTSGLSEGESVLGVLKLDGDKLTVAFGRYGSNMRPKNFDSADGIEVNHLIRKK